MTVSEDTTEFWVRNARLYMDEALECDQLKFVWDVSYLNKYKAIRDIDAFMKIKCRGRQWEYIKVGVDEASWHDPLHPRKNPLAVWPVWRFDRHTLADLEQWVAKPVGQNRTLCEDTTVSSHCRPVWGQQDRVIVYPGKLQGAPAQERLRNLADIQAEYPDVILHLTNTGSFRYGFGLGFGAFDFEARGLSHKGFVHLPSGRQITEPEYGACEEWINLMGFTPHQLLEKENRVKFVIRSGQWAGENFRKNVKWKTKGFASSPFERVNKTTWFRQTKPADTDMLACYKCSLQLSCKFYREGSVCSVPGSEGKDLANMFKSRDAETIVDALSQLLATNATRLDNALDNEAERGDIDPAVTKLIESTWDRGERLAKLLDPNLGQPDKPAGGNLNFINVNTAKSPKDLAAAVFAELEARGVSRDQITPELVENLMQMTVEEKKKAINVLAVGSGSS